VLIWAEVSNWLSTEIMFKTLKTLSFVNKFATSIAQSKFSFLMKIIN